VIKSQAREDRQTGQLRHRAVGRAALDAIAARHGTLHLDTTALPEAYERRMWSVDRFHPDRAGGILEH
jgi:hypothetical protein